METTIVDLIVALEEMSENHQVPQDLSFGHHGYLKQILWWSILEIDLRHDTKEQESHKCGNVLFFRRPKATSMHESINRIWQPSPVENKEVNKVQPQCSLDVSQGAVSHCFSRRSRKLPALSKINDT